MRRPSPSGIEGCCETVFEYQEGGPQEVIRVTQWAEIRQMHWVDGVPKKEVARRLGLDVKTVRRALERVEPPHQRQSPPRGRQLDRYSSGLPQG